MEERKFKKRLNVKIRENPFLRLHVIKHFDFTKTFSNYVEKENRILLDFSSSPTRAENAGNQLRRFKFVAIQTWWMDGI